MRHFLILLVVVLTISPAAAQETPDWWQVYFTTPPGKGQPTIAVGGIDRHLIDAIESAEHTIDLAVFEMNLASLTNALIDAAERGVQVRVVTDDEHGLEDDFTTLTRLVPAGIAVIDDDRSDLMHNKFVVIDEQQVWTGSWNLTINGTFRNNNNVIAITSPDLAAIYTREFEEMFFDRAFGGGYPFYYYATLVNQTATVQATRIQALFSPEDTPDYAIAHALAGAEESIRFMAFSFTHDALGAALMARAAGGVEIQGIFEKRGSETEYSELPLLACNGLDVRQDGNPRVLHHKVFIIDEETVITGSFNFSASASEGNDENLLIIQDVQIAAAYTAEFARRWEEATAPDRADLDCQWITGAGWDCARARYRCGDFQERCRYLCAYQAACPGDPSRLDRNADGWACESTCPPCE